MIKVKNLYKSYSDKEVLKGINFTVNNGEVLGFLGPNGAGKSTTMNIITGYISSTSGTVTIDGIDIIKEPIKAKKMIGYLPEKPPLYMDMTVKSYLGFMFDLKKIKIDKKSHIENVCEIVGISDVYNRTIKKLSKGYKQRVGIAQALLGEPKVIILDEPTVGLDPKQVISIRNLIKNLSYNHTIILSSHILSEIQAVCDRVVVINDGKVVADGSAEDISKEASGVITLKLQVDGDKNTVFNAINDIEGIIDIDSEREVDTQVCEYIVKYYKDNDIRRDVFKKLAEVNCPIIEMYSSSPSLEDVFLMLTEKDDVRSNKDVNYNEPEKASKMGDENNDSNI